MLFHYVILLHNNSVMNSFPSRLTVLSFLFAVFRKIFRAAINDAILLLTVIPHGGSCRCEPCPLASRKPGQVPDSPLLSTRWRQIQSVLIENYNEARRSRKIG